MVPPQCDRTSCADNGPHPAVTGRDGIQALKDCWGELLPALEVREVSGGECIDHVR